MFQRQLILSAIFLCAMFSPAYAWEIADYRVEIRLEKDSHFLVTEKIDADFGYESKHGIYRDIPIDFKNENGHSYNVRFTDFTIQDENGRAWDYTEEDNGYVHRLRIGSAYRTVSGRQTYIISYRVTGAILFLPEQDQLFWNAVGNQWDVNIKQVRVSLFLPVPVAKESLKIATYTGRRGSRTSNARSEAVNDQLIEFAGDNYLPYEGFTVVVGVPKGILTPPAVSDFDQSSVANEDHSYNPYDVKPPIGPWSLLIPVVSFFVMYNLWRHFGKDPHLNKSIVVEYQAPDNLKPAEVGTLIDYKLDQRDISATIIDLAIRGYLKIVQQDKNFVGKDYSFILLKAFEADALIKPYERIILRSIFGGKPVSSEVKLYELENRFYEKVDVIEGRIKDELRPKKYLENHPTAIVIFYTAIAGVVFFLGVFSSAYDSWLMGSLLLSSLIILLFGVIMPKRTVEGTEILSKILGFKEFLLRTEKDKIQRADQQNVFERMLPYAICLGMSTKWATKFDGLYTQSPQWFAGNYTGVFIFDHFVHDLNRSLDHMGSSFYSSPQTVSSGGGFSVGGGFSGGGFGGGGGGSW